MKDVHKIILRGAALILSLMFMATSVFSQCNLSYRSLPAIQGIKLNTQPLSRDWIALDNSREPRQEWFLLRVPRGELTRAHIETFAGRIWKYDLEYETASEWNTPLQFGRHLSDVLGLPRDTWEVDEDSVLPSDEAIIRCADFSITVKVRRLRPLNSMPRITVQRTDLDRAIAEAERRYSVDARNSFRP